MRRRERRRRRSAPEGIGRVEDGCGGVDAHMRGWLIGEGCWWVEVTTSRKSPRCTTGRRVAWGRGDTLEEPRACVMMNEAWTSALGCIGPGERDSLRARRGSHRYRSAHRRVIRMGVGEGDISVWLECGVGVVEVFSGEEHGPWFFSTEDTELFVVGSFAEEEECDDDGEEGYATDSTSNDDGTGVG